MTSHGTGTASAVEPTGRVGCVDIISRRCSPQAAACQAAAQHRLSNTESPIKSTYRKPVGGGEEELGGVDDCCQSLALTATGEIRRVKKRGMNLMGSVVLVQ